MNTNNRQKKRAARTRGKIRGTSEKPRLSVFRSNTHVYAQLIDDQKKVSLFGISDKVLEKATGTKTAIAKQLGIALAKIALEKKIKNVVFDKGSYAYHGRVKALAEGAREGGLQF